MDRSRRDRFADVRPLGDELRAALLLAGLLVLLTAPLLVQGAVVWLIDGDFAWPSGHLATAYSGLAHGRFGAGLAPGVERALPPDAALWVLAGTAQALACGAVVVAGRWVSELAGGDDRHGIATSAQAAQALGVRRLRSNAHVVRPDLYGRPRRARRVRGV